jgi:hypothetical protein
LFRRTEKDPAQDSAATDTKIDGKGRPTPTRKEAEAAARDRARNGTSTAGMDKATAKKVLRERRASDNAKVRAGMRAGDERFLPARDQGPVRRYIRDYVDSRVCFGELLLLLLVVIMVLQSSHQSGLVSLSNGIWTATLLLTVVDTGWMVFRLRRQLKAKFPDENLKGTSFYAIMRMLQIRWMRMPKRQVKLGGKPR